MLTFGTKLNRSYSLYLPFAGKYESITIYFHKGNTSIGFKPDHNLQELSKNGNISITMYKDLKKSTFASTFLDIKDFTSDTLNIKNQFSNVLDPFKEKIQYIANESIKLSKFEIDDGKKVLENLLYVYTFTFTDYDNEYLFVLAERQHIDTLLCKKFVRTSGIQISTLDCLNDMLKIAEHYKGISVRNLEKKTDADEEIRNLFPDKKASVKRL